MQRLEKNGLDPRGFKVCVIAPALATILALLFLTAAFAMSPANAPAGTGPPHAMEIGGPADVPAPIPAMGDSGRRPPTGIPRDQVVEALARRYAEHQTVIGLDRTGGVIEVFSSDDRSTWTMVLTMPDGMSYVITSGSSWTPVTRAAGRPS